MTRPRNPREWDDAMLVRQLKRRLRGTDVRTRDLVSELELRLWSRTFEIERMNEGLSGIRHDVEATSVGLREIAHILGAPEPRPKLDLVKGGDDG